MEHAHRRARSRARSLAYGRRRAARRVDAGRFVAHPGWRHRVPEGRVRLAEQATALARVAELVDAELWRADREAVALVVLRGLVCGMDWETGLVAGVTRAHLAAAAGCSVRTVSRVLAWAIEAGLVVCVESGATAEFLGTDCNRAPSYVVTVPVGWSPPRLEADVAESTATAADDDAQCGPVDGLGNPPASCVGKRSPWRDRGPEKRHDEPGQGPGAGGWPVFDRATTGAQRAAAVDTLLERTGLGARVVRWRARALLGPWFEAGWCVAGLLHALDHHPGHPEVSRGDAARAARDPLAVLGHRLRPWRGRLDDLPAVFTAVDGTERRRRAAAHADTDPISAPAPGWSPSSRAAGAAGGRPGPTEAARSARAEIGRVLDRRRRDRPYRAHVDP